MCPGSQGTPVRVFRVKSKKIKKRLLLGSSAIDSLQNAIYLKYLALKLAKKSAARKTPFFEKNSPVKRIQSQETPLDSYFLKIALKSLFLDGFS